MIQTYILEKSLKQIDISKDHIPKKGNLWIDVTNITENEKDLLAEKFNLHSLTAEDLIHPGTRIKIEEFDEYMFSVSYSLQNNKKFELIELDYVLGKNFIITNHKKAVSSIDLLKKDPEKIKSLLSKGPDFLFHTVLDAEIDNYFPILDDQEEVILKYEQEAINKPSPEVLANILNMKKELVKIKRVTTQQKEKISFLSKNQYAFISKKAVPYFRDVYDHIIRVNDALENYRESVGSAFEVYMGTVSNNMNEVMKTLSIIATIALPLSVISGIYGTNFVKLPGSNVVNGFWIMIIVMLLMIFSMITYFKRKSWI